MARDEVGTTQLGVLSPTHARLGYPIGRGILATPEKKPAVGYVLSGFSPTQQTFPNWKYILLKHESILFLPTR